ncbi:hypothetical protein MMC21_003088 [Puttea exsequens]|nr:hypothetical protein [Puttea exsequens]
MTQYISSFLIDPVVRQARRFSRSGNEPPNSEIRARPSYTRHEGETPHHSSSAAAGALNEVPLPVGISIDDLPGSVVTDGPEVLSPVALGEHRDLQQWTSIHEASSAASSLGTETLDSEANDRRQVSTTVETWNNPLSRVHGDPRSLSSSMSSLHQSMTEANMSSADPSVQPARRNTHHSRGRGDSQGSTAGNAALPADDGMSFMRRRIIAIQRTTSSNEEKARLVHGVMTEKHNASQQSLHASHVARAQSPCSMHSSERPFTPSSPKSMDSMRRTISPPTSSSSNADPANRFYLSPDDLRPTYYQKPTLDSKGEEREVSSMEVEDALKALGCAHYKRNIKLQCSACHRWYTCRFCHDEVEDHMLNRRETKSMLCMLCGCAQPASEECATCNERAAWYYCDVCKLWDDDSEKSIYHCNDCGICRIGEGLGKDFFHCKVGIMKGYKGDER